MPGNDFTEGVRPGGLTSGPEIRILLCYILDSVGSSVTKNQLEEVLLGEALVNYFALAESIAQLIAQNLVVEDEQGLVLTERGQTVGRTLFQDLPRTVRDTAVRGVIRAQQFASKKAAHRSEIIANDRGRTVQCTIDDTAGALLKLDLYMPDDLSAEAVRDLFIEKGDVVYKLVLAALTNNRTLVERALSEMSLPIDNT